MVGGMSPTEEPSRQLSDPRELVSAYLDYYRSEVLRALEGVASPEVSKVPTGWTPLAMLNHLAYLERRRSVWGFLGEQVADPHGDRDSGEALVATESYEEIKAFY